MELHKYLAKKKLGVDAFGKLIGRHRTTVTRLIDGETKPDWQTMETIYRVTGGKVRPNDFLRIT